MRCVTIIFLPPGPPKKENVVSTLNNFILGLTLRSQSYLKRYQLLRLATLPPGLSDRVADFPCMESTVA
jgi:hypothetical protein